MRRLAALLSACLASCSALSPPAVTQSQNRDEALITVEWRGAAHMRTGRPGAHFDLMLYGNGLVIYEGERGVRVHGEQKSRLPAHAVHEWRSDLLTGGILKEQDSPIPADVTWFQITVTHPSGSRTVRRVASFTKSDDYLMRTTSEILTAVWASPIFSDTLLKWPT